MESIDTFRWMCRNGFLNEAYERACRTRNVDVLKALIDNGFVGDATFYENTFHSVCSDNSDATREFVKFLLAYEVNVLPHLNSMLYRAIGISEGNFWKLVSAQVHTHY